MINIFLFLSKIFIEMDEEKGPFIETDEEKGRGQQDGKTNDVFVSFILIVLLSERTQHLIEDYTLKDDGSSSFLQ